MKSNRRIARDISYVKSAKTRRGKALIRALENSTGRLRIIRRAKGYERDLAAGQNIWEVMCARYGLRLDIRAGSLDNFPKTGPLVIVSNHPFGILDGLMMGRILSIVRPDFRIMAHQVFDAAPDIRDAILPICFDTTRAAVQININTRKKALRFLGEGGAIGIFPGATVSTSARMFSQPMDPAWRMFTAKIITRAKATVVPIHFSGQNSRLFQIASHLHNNLRVALMIHEFRTRLDRQVPVVIGQPIGPDALDAYAHTPADMMDFLRKSTYDLSPKPLRNLEYGFENEKKYKTKP